MWVRAVGGGRCPGCGGCTQWHCYKGGWDAADKVERNGSFPQFLPMGSPDTKPSRSRLKRQEYLQYQNVTWSVVQGSTNVFSRTRKEKKKKHFSLDMVHHVGMTTVLTFTRTHSSVGSFYNTILKSSLIFFFLNMILLSGLCT